MINSEATTAEVSTEEALFPRIAAGDAGAMEECARRFGPMLWSLARRFTRSHVDAEDAVQDILLCIWQNASRFDHEAGSAATFVATIARRRLVDLWRYKSRRPSLASLDARHDLSRSAGSHDPRRSGASLSDVDATPKLQRLSPTQQRALHLSLMGLSHHQIAAATDEPLGTIKTNIRRGLIRLRTLVDAEPRGAK